MVKTAIADESYLTYLKSLCKPDTCTVGLILGQPSTGKDFIIHLARTPLGQCDTAAKKSITPVKPVKHINEVSESVVADHAKHATRMLPGGMFVLGIFVVSEEDIFSPVDSKLVAILNQISKQLSMNSFVYGNPSNCEKLVLNLCTTTQTYTCKSYESSTFKPAEIKFQPKIATKWLQLECKYELDQVFTILEKDIGWPLRRYMTNILESINKNLHNAVFIIDGEIKDNDEYLESVGKKRKLARSKTGYHENTDSKALSVTILSPCKAPDSNTDPEITDCGSKIRLTGHVASKVWLHPKATIGTASEAIVQDIVRSLAARLEMHWDSLIEEEHGSPEDTNSIHEPPRRVLVTLPSSKITLSDYLFPGEGPQESQISLQELLDITLTADSEIKDIEGQAGRFE
ncbi:protein odr-4 homolog isoform X2 [Agrilus planipennis]|uniref:Protein odr-4 homolog isoform X2 n=1 Tax=Agrilus planipennis TaxID=224129 RepID=A0A1W4WFY2_AGRPL|nr:protein odr-4 homolog isoform X2 [Agrilus planipennis]